MLLYPRPALVTPFSRTFINKGNAKNGRIPPYCSFPTLMTPFPATGCTSEEAISAINETVIGTIIAGRN